MSINKTKRMLAAALAILFVFQGLAAPLKAVADTGESKQVNLIDVSMSDVDKNAFSEENKATVGETVYVELSLQMPMDSNGENLSLALDIPKGLELEATSANLPSGYGTYKIVDNCLQVDYTGQVPQDGGEETIDLKGQFSADVLDEASNGAVTFEFAGTDKIKIEIPFAQVQEEVSDIESDDIETNATETDETETDETDDIEMNLTNSPALYNIAEDKDLLSTSVAIDTDTTVSAERLIYTVDANVAKLSLDSYTVTPNFSGDTNGIVDVVVYKVIGSTVTLADPSEYTYNPVTGAVTLNNISDTYQIDYIVDLSQSYTVADMANGTGPVVSGSFTADVISESGNSQEVTQSCTFEPLNLQNINNSTIISDYTLSIINPNTGSAELVLQWQLDDLLLSDGIGTGTVDYHAGSYFVFKLDPDQIEIYNDTAGDLTLVDNPAVVGTYYVTPDGYVILVLDRYVESVEEIKGQLSITSTVDATSGDEFELNLDINGETKVPGNNELDYGLSKSGEVSGSTGLLWTILVNTEEETLTNLTITDSAQGTTSNANDYSWEFEGGIKVYEWDSENSIKGIELDSSAYTASLVNGTWTIQIHGDVEGKTDKAYCIELTAESTNSVGTGGTTGTYNNTVKAKEDNTEELSDTASVTKSFTGISKTGKSSTSSDGTIGTTDWTITYKTGGQDISIDEIYIEDRLYQARWYNASGEYSDRLDFKDYNPSDWTTLLQGMEITYTGIDGTQYLLSANDYTVSVSYNSPTYTIGIEFTGDFSTAIGSDTINGELSIKYTTETDLTSQTPPEGAQYWRIYNEVVTQDNSTSNVTPYAYYLVKSAGAPDYNNSTVKWTITLYGGNQGLKEGDIIYDVLPEGFTVLADTLKVYNSTQSVEVDTASSPTEEYFAVDYTAKNVTLGSNNIVYGNDEGFALTYHHPSGGESTDVYTITFTSKFQYDPDKIGDAGYAQNTTNVNNTYWVSGNEYHSAEANVTLSGAFDSNGSKSGTYIPKVEDGVVKDSQIKWTVYANSLNQDISGYTFTDELKVGLPSAGATSTVANSEQTISLADVKVYTYTVGLSGGKAVYTLDPSDPTLETYLKSNNCISVIDNIVTINFPTDFADKFEAGGALESLSSMRFAVVLTSTLEDKVAPYYPNTAVLTDGSDTISEWDAHVSVNHAANSLEKSGTVSGDGASVFYSVVLNKDQYLVKDLEIIDSLMYSSTNQIMYLMADPSNPTGYDLHIYKAEVTLDANGELTYSKGAEIPAAEYILTYTPGDMDNQGFHIDMKSDINSALILEYNCGLDTQLIEVNDTLSNKIKVTGTATAEDEWATKYKYTSSSGSFKGENVDISLRKVDQSGKTLTGATFTLWNYKKHWPVKSGEVDENGKLYFESILTGTYYLVEDAPEGYETDFDTIDKAIVVAISKDSNTDEVTVTLGSGENAQSWVGTLEDGPEMVIKNSQITGGFKLQKKANDLNGAPTENPVTNAEFVLYKLVNDQKMYYNGTDANGVLQFLGTDLQDAIVLRTDQSGVLEANHILSDTYYLEEINAPVGYELLEEPVEFVIPSGETKELTLYDDITVTEISGLKIWDDEVYPYNRPSSITVNLYQNDASDPYASQVVTADENGEWSYTFTNLPKYDSDGEEYDYTVGEEAVPGYDTTVSGYNITNQLITVDITGTKIWEDKGNESERPESITVNLHRNGGEEPIATQEVTPDEDGEWTYTFTNLPKYNAKGVEYEYTLTEDTVNGYETTVNGYDITNQLITVDVAGTKSWEDKGYESERPKSITVNLHRNGEAEPLITQKVTSGEDGKWTFTFASLPKYDSSGKEYVYSISEDAVKGYKTTVNGYDIVNTKETEKTGTNTNNKLKKPSSSSISAIKTGDESDIVLFLIMSGVSLTALCVAVILKKRYRVNK